MSVVELCIEMYSWGYCLPHQATETGTCGLIPAGKGHMGLTPPLESNKTAIFPPPRIACICDTELAGGFTGRSDLLNYDGVMCHIPRLVEQITWGISALVVLRVLVNVVIAFRFQLKKHAEKRKITRRRTRGLRPSSIVGSVEEGEKPDDLDPDISFERQRTMTESTGTATGPTPQTTFQLASANYVELSRGDVQGKLSGKRGILRAMSGGRLSQSSAMTNTRTISCPKIFTPAFHYCVFTILGHASLMTAAILKAATPQVVGYDFEVTLLWSLGWSLSFFAAIPLTNTTFGTVSKGIINSRNFAHMRAKVFRFKLLNYLTSFCMSVIPPALLLYSTVLHHRTPHYKRLPTGTLIPAFDPIQSDMRYILVAHNITTGVISVLFGVLFRMGYTMTREIRVSMLRTRSSNAATRFQKSRKPTGRSFFLRKKSSNTSSGGRGSGSSPDSTHQRLMKTLIGIENMYSFNVYKMVFACIGCAASSLPWLWPYQVLNLAFTPMILAHSTQELVRLYMPVRVTNQGSYTQSNLSATGRSMPGEMIVPRPRSASTVPMDSPGSILDVVREESFLDSKGSG